MLSPASRCRSIRSRGRPKRMVVVFHVKHIGRVEVLFHVKQSNPDDGEYQVDQPNPFDRAEVQQVADGAAAMGVTLTAPQAELIARHLHLVYDTNEHLNLTRIPRDEAVRMHVLDSLAGLPEMSCAPEGPWLDIGSGAGYPGMVLAVTVAHRVDLLESVGKKARFLEAVSREVCPNTAVLGQRAEDAAVQHRNEYAAVSARAVSELPALVELASPLLALHGLLVCWKGEPDDAELQRGDVAAAKVGLRRLRVRTVSVPGLDAQRCLVVYEKERQVRIALPRRVGLAQSKPLA